MDLEKLLDVFVKKLSNVYNIFLWISTSSVFKNNIKYILFSHNIIIYIIIMTILQFTLYRQSVASHLVPTMFIYFLLKCDEKLWENQLNKFN